MPAILDSRLIHEVVDAFPRGNGWMAMFCSQLGRGENDRQASWKPIAPLRRVGGVYALLLPQSEFSPARSIDLHGPKRSRIRFEFTLKSVTPDGFGVAYCGRTTNLAQRFRGHLSPGKRKDGGQVKYGLMDATICADEHAALTFLRTHGRIVYRILDGPEQTANRDIIELSLCARYCPPFNIKSER